MLDAEARTALEAALATYAVGRGYNVPISQNSLLDASFVAGVMFAARLCREQVRFNDGRSFGSQWCADTIEASAGGTT